VTIVYGDDMPFRQDDLPTVGIVGAGQLALMLYEASLRLGVPVVVLGAEADPAVRAAPGSIVGDPRSGDDLRALAERCDVVTFDHELVDPALLSRLESEGVVLHPSAATMAVAVDKEAQQRLFTELGLPLPPTVVAADPEAAAEAARAFGPPVVVKTAHGGYDGRGVGLLDDRVEVEAWIGERPGPFLVQPCLELEAEVAVQVVRSPEGAMATYPVVRTVQEDGMCAVVAVPSGLPAALEDDARRIAERIAEALGVVGLLAVELFVVDGRLYVNEIAARPHNSGHVTQDSSLTSQFDNHLRAVCGLPLGATDLVVPAAAMVNVVGYSRHEAPDLRTAPPDVAVHLYGKDPWPGRKLGHVTAVATTVEEATARARKAADVLNGVGADR
jgi:5-(carboxyamino)imidazole ribonucleotide synthase